MRTARLAALLVLGAIASSALGGEVLQLKDGKLVAGKIVKLDDTGVTFAPQAGGEMRIGWELVVPLSRYDLWQSTLAADDAAGRVALGKWALTADLFLYARRELVKAKGLGYSGPEKLDELIGQVDRDEADAALGDIEALLAANDLEKALERVRSYLRTAPPAGAETARFHARADDITKRIELRDAEEKEADAAKKKAEKEGKLKEWIERNLLAAKKAQTDAGERAASGYANVAKGNQTRARDDLAAAESGFQGARAVYRRVKKSAGAGDVADRCDREMKDCDRRTVDVLVRWAGMEVGNKSWKTASPIVDRGLKVDPVDRELLDLRQKIDENWIRRRFSDITNAHPHESNN